MISIYFVTSNYNKLNEAKNAFKKSNFKVKKLDLELPENQHESQDQIILQKLKYAWKSIKSPLFVDDTAIYFERFPNFPGIITKQFVSGLGIKNIQKIIREKEPAYFRTLVGYADSNGFKIFEGVLKGRLTKKNPGKINPLAQFSSIFIPDKHSRTLEEIGGDIVSSHRRKALQKLKVYLDYKYK